MLSIKYFVLKFATSGKGDRMCPYTIVFFIMELCVWKISITSICFRLEFHGWGGAGGSGGETLIMCFFFPENIFICANRTDVPAIIILYTDSPIFMFAPQESDYPCPNPEN